MKSLLKSNIHLVNIYASHSLLPFPTLEEEVSVASERGIAHSKVLDHSKQMTASLVSSYGQKVVHAREEAEIELQLKCLFKG